VIRFGLEDGPLLRALRREGLDSVEGAFACGAGEDLDKPDLGHRRRTRLELTDETGRTHRVYLKRYGPAAGRAGRVAIAEFENIRAARDAGVATMQALVAGERADPDGRRRSYLVATAVPGDALERCCEDFLARRSADDVTEFTRRLAGLVRQLHGAGYCHRDLYASHVFLSESDEAFELCLIDLARMFRPRWRRLRWRVKDLAQLKYSMPAQWVASRWDAFLTAYLGEADAGAAGRYHRRIDRKVAEMTRRSSRHRR